MDTKFLEQFYTNVILPQYGGAVKDIFIWKDHGKPGQNTYAHYFEDSDGVEYVLLNEDFPNGDYMNDNFTHDVVIVPGSPDNEVLKVSIGETWIPNISGYFTLYKEKHGAHTN